MKWFKHDTDAFMSEGIDSAFPNRDKWANYGRWCRLLEIVAFKMSDKPGEEHGAFAEYSIQKWCELLGLKPKKFLSFTQQIHNKLKTKTEQNQNIVRIEIPNLLQKKDNHSKDLEAASKSLPLHSSSSSSSTNKVSTPRKSSSPKKGNITYSPGFLSFWQVYPRKEGKGDAWEEWQKKGCESLTEAILSAVGIQKEWETWKKEGGRFRPHPSTWLHQNRWEDEGMEPVKELTTDPKLNKTLINLSNWANKKND